MGVNFHKAVDALYPNAKTVDYPTETKPATVKDAEGNLIVIDMDAINAWVDPEQYKYDRASAYPSITDQLDQIYHEGIDAWKADIKAIKDKYAKPEAE